MARALAAVLVAVSASAAAQTAPARPPPTSTAPRSAQSDAAPAQPPGDQSQQDVDQKIEAAKKEIREEVRAQLATQSASQGWDEEFADQTRKLELLELDGYLRVRPDLFHKLDLNRNPDPSGFTLFPRPVSEKERTLAGVNMRARIEPTINVSEEVRIKLQIDALDNLVFGSSPAYATGSDRYEFGVMSNTQVPPSVLNSVRDSILVKRAYGEVSTPIGILRFGRMGSHWGLGMVHNDGNCLDCDFGDTVDRIQFVTEPFTGWYLTPMLDFDVEGPISGSDAGQGQPFDLSNTDDSHSYILAIARRDTEQQERARLDNGLSVLNYGIHFTYRAQSFDPVGLLDPANPLARQSRHATIYIPDLWGKLEHKSFRLELEGAAVLGNVEAAVGPSDAQRVQQLTLRQFGAVGRGEYRFMEGQLRLGLEAGFASGDRAPGFGNRPARKTGDPAGNPVPNDIDGRQYGQYPCGGGTCNDTSIRNFQFNRDFRPDLILFRELLGGITDAVYAKPTLTYAVAEGFDVFGSVVGSGAVYTESTPSGLSRWLGVEIDAGARYETEDGFIAQLQWGVLFPQNGLKNVTGVTLPPLDTAQVLRAIIGIKY